MPSVQTSSKGPKNVDELKQPYTMVILAFYMIP